MYGKQTIWRQEAVKCMIVSNAVFARSIIVGGVMSDISMTCLEDNTRWRKVIQVRVILRDGNVVFRRDHFDIVNVPSTVDIVSEKLDSIESLASDSDVRRII